MIPGGGPAGLVRGYACYRALGEVLGLDDADWQAQYDPARWLALHARLEALFATRTREYWCALFDGSDACIAPVLSLEDAPDHPHNRAREAFIEVDGITQPAPAPRFSRTPGVTGGAVPVSGADNEALLRELGRPWPQKVRSVPKG